MKSMLLLPLMLLIQINTAPIPITISSINEYHNPTPTPTPIPTPTPLPIKPLPIPKGVPQFYPKPLPYVQPFPYVRPISYAQPLPYVTPQPVIIPSTLINVNSVNTQPIELQMLDDETLNALGEIDEQNICEAKGKYGQLCLLRGSIPDDDDTRYHKSFKCLKQAKCAFREGRCQWLKTKNYKKCSNYLRGGINYALS